METTSFANLNVVPERPGVYEIHTKSGIALKVGIAADLRRRLRQHGRSRQSRLRLIDGGTWDVPADVQSTQSILAKHLFFDRSLTADYDLQTEQGRQNFLVNECIVKYTTTADRAAAREIERRLELGGGGFRYLGSILVR